jgi:hypothetical protein
MRIKHNKFRNTGILFELLIRQIASDTISGNNSPAIDLVKKYFSKTELAKEHKLYQALLNNKSLTESKADSLINTTLEISTRLNKSSLRREKYNLIKEIKENYDLDEFFKAKINNYSQFASIYNLIEAKDTKEFVNPEQIVENKITLLEYITHKEIDKEATKDRLLEEYSNLDKGNRILVYRILLEKFNEKYSNLNNTQKDILKEYINNISNTIKLRDFVNENYNILSKKLTELSKKVEDKTTQIKLNEVINLLQPLDKKTNVKDENVVSLLQYYQLVEELNKI